MSDTKKQSNAVPLFSWSVIGETNRKFVITDFHEINRPENRELIKKLHFYYNGEYRGTVDLSDKTQRLILVRRHQQDYTENLRAVGEERIIWIVGWQSTVEGKNVKAILELHEDGEIVMKNNDGRT